MGGKRCTLYETSPSREVFSFLDRIPPQRRVWQACDERLDRAKRQRQKRYVAGNFVGATGSKACAMNSRDPLTIPQRSASAECAASEDRLTLLCGVEGEGAVVPELFASLAAHEVDCSACARDLVAYRTTVRLIRGLSSPRNRARA